MSRRQFPYISIALIIIAVFLISHATGHTATSILVTNLSDSGPGSLRDAMDKANADGGPSLIMFDPDLSGGSIPLESALPCTFDDYTTIEGDINGDHLPDIELNGENVLDGSGPGQLPI